MKTRFLPAAIAAALFLSSCAGGWQEEDKAAFLQTCREGVGRHAISDEQANSYCDCRLRKTMQRYSTINEVVENRDSVALDKDLHECETMSGL